MVANNPGTRLLLAMNGVNLDSKDIYIKSGSASVGDRKRKLGRGKAAAGRRRRRPGLQGLRNRNYALEGGTKTDEHDGMEKLQVAHRFYCSTNGTTF